MKKSILLTLIFMFFIPCILIMGVNQPVYGLTYTKLTTGTASASSSNSSYPPAYAFDSNTSTAWSSFPVLSNPSVEYLKYQLPSAKVVQQYKLIASTPISSWGFYGSNNGSSWTLLHTGTSSNLGQLITINNTTPYLYYKISGYGILIGVQMVAIPPMPPSPVKIYAMLISELELYAPDPPTASFSASSTTINLGSSSTLTWSTANATSVSFSPSIGSTALNDSIAVLPTTNTTYTMTVTGPGGSITKTVTVNVVTPPKGAEYTYDELGRIQSIIRVK